MVQRAKLRKQLQEGGIVDPPIMYQTYGSFPPWLIDHRLGQEQQEPQVQDGGSTANRSQFEDGGSASSGSRVQVGGSSGSSDPMLLVGGGQPSALPTLAADRRDQIREAEGFPRPSLRISAGVVDSGSWDSLSRFARAVGGRTIVWRIRDEMTSGWLCGTCSSGDCGSYVPVWCSFRGRAV